MQTVFSSCKSPVGILWILVSEKGLHALTWKKEPSFAQAQRDDQHPMIVETIRQLQEYFQGKRKKFDLPLLPAGTEFQTRAWKGLRQIPYGKVISYQDQAAALGDLKKARAVGGANRRNPICIIVPCHRVIAKDGALRGFAGGLGKKKFLLELERSGRP